MWRSRRSGGTQTPEVECSRYGSSTNSRRSRQPETGRTTTLIGDGPYQCRLPSTSSPRCAGTSARSSSGRPARRTCCPTSAAWRARPGPWWRWRAPSGSCSAPTTTSASPPTRASAQAARDALDRYGTGLTGSAAAQRHARPAPGPRARARGVDGDRGGDRLLDRPPGQRRHARDDPRPRRHRDRRLRRPRLDPRRLPDLARQAAPVQAQPAREAREDAPARRRGRRRRAGGRRRRLLAWRATSRRCRGSSSCARPTARG